MFENVRLIIGAIGLSAGGVWMLSGSAQESAEFDLPAATVIERLAASHSIVEGTGMGSLSVSGESRGGAGQVKIGVTRAGSSGKVICSVAVEATSPKTSRTNLDCAQTGANEDQTKALGGEAMKIVVAEHIVASVLRQPYNTDKVANEMLAFMTRSAPMLAASMKPPEETPSDRAQRLADRQQREDADFYSDADAGESDTDFGDVEAGADSETGESFE